MDKALIEKMAAELKLPAAKLAAVIQVESAGAGFFTDIDGKQKVKILFEPHVFNSYTKGKYLKSHRHLAKENFDETKASGHYNKRQYPIYEEAFKLDPYAASLSTSFGLGQIMGFNHQKAGYASLDSFVKAMKESEYKQAKAMVTLILSSKAMKDAFDKSDWKKLARLYNGKGYALNEYDKKLKEAYEKAKSIFSVTVDTIQKNPIKTVIMLVGIAFLLFYLLQKDNALT